MSRNLEPLPIDAVLPRITGALAGSSSVVLRAPTGAGKTTRVPPALLDAGRDGGRRIIVLEPRRIAARAAARRIADERGWRLGGDVGYHVRFDRRAGRATRILVVTEGVLVQMLQNDPFLADVGLVVFDEFHERRLQSDLALAMTRRVREARGDLAIVVMSATLEPRPIAAFLGDCPTVESAGRLHPVEVRYLEQADPRPLEDVVATGVARALSATGGDVLAFLPGVAEIRRSAARLEDVARRQGLRVMSLYGDLPAEQQDAVLRPGSRRKVVLATNVAETSITICGITAVVDSGLVREMRFDPSHGLDRLELGRISRASAEQRAGRAGRQGPGLCWRLWTAHDDRSLAERATPEIQRVDLGAPVLQLLTWGESDVERFGWFEPPDPAALHRALELLADLGARDRHGPTELGRAMARLPVHPRMARLLIAGRRRGEARRAALCAALLSERDLVHRSAGRREAATTGPSDLLDRLDAVESFAASGYGETALGPVHSGRARQVLRVARQLEKLARRVPASKAGVAASSDSEEILLRALLAAYPDRVARRREAGSRRGVMVGGRGIRLAEASCVRHGDLFLCLELDSKGREAWVRQASRIEAVWLASDQLQVSTEAVFDDERERVVGRLRVRYRDLVIEGERLRPHGMRSRRDHAAVDRRGRRAPRSCPVPRRPWRRVLSGAAPQPRRVAPRARLAVVRFAGSRGAAAAPGGRQTLLRRAEARAAARDSAGRPGLRATLRSRPRGTRAPRGAERQPRPPELRGGQAADPGGPNPGDVRSAADSCRRRRPGARAAPSAGAQHAPAAGHPRPRQLLAQHLPRGAQRAQGALSAPRLA